MTSFLVKTGLFLGQASSDPHSFSRLTRMTLHRRLLLIFTAVVLTGLLGLGAFLYLQYRASTSLLSLLPKDQVRAYFHRLEIREIRSFSSTYVALSAIPDREGLFSLAILNDGWLLTPASDDATLEGLPAPLWNGRPVLRSFPTEIPTAQKGQALKDDEVFARLFSGIDTERWAWMSALPMDIPLKTDVILGGNQHGGVLIGIRSEKDVSVRYATKESPYTVPVFAGDSAVMQVPSSPNNGLCIGSADATTLPNLLATTTDPLLQQELLTQEIESLLGAEISLQYDLAPLLRRPTTACLAGEGNARTGLLLGEFTGGRTAWDSLALRLHDSFNARHAEGTVERRLVDDEYEYAIAKSTTTSSETTTRTEGGWAIRETVTGSGSGLFTARRGNRFLIATSQDWLHAGLNATPSAPSTFAGSIDMRAMTMTDLPVNLRILLPLFQGSTEVEWSVVTQNGITSVHLQAD